MSASYAIEEDPGTVPEQGPRLYDWYYDRLMPLLLPEEWSMVCYLGRRTWGFRKREDRVSVDQFVHGVVGRSGQQLDRGTALGRDTVIRKRQVLLGLRVFLLGSKGALRLPSRVETIDWDALETRRSERDREAANRTAAAREKRHTGGRSDRPKPVGGTDRRSCERGSVRQTQTGRPDRPRGVCGTDAHESRSLRGVAEGGVPTPLPAKSSLPELPPAGEAYWTDEERAVFEEMGALACGRSAASNLETVRQFQKRFRAGLTAPMLRAIVEDTMDRRGGEPLGSMNYFLKQIDRELAEMSSPPPSRARHGEKDERRNREIEDATAAVLRQIGLSASGGR